MTNRDTILRWLFPPAGDDAAWCVVKAALFTIAGCAGGLLALI
jgi:hypothetical protein